MALPGKHEEFRNKDYWDEFFKKRNEEGTGAFEWYGSFEEIYSCSVLQECKVESRILMIGCGNSEISAEFYDKGYHSISNVDYSELVINEMIEKNTDKRPKMQWNVGDMTSMHDIYPIDSCFDVIFDKGALDALMSVDTEEVRRLATQMFHEIERLLELGSDACDGSYFCITLAENFIIRHMLTHFLNGKNTKIKGWSIAIRTIAKTKRSPFVPFLVQIRKCGVPEDTSGIHMHFNHYGGAVAENNAEIVYDVEKCLQKLEHVQEYAKKQFEVGQLKKGRFEELHLWDEKVSTSIPRFTIFIVDMEDESSTGPSNPGTIPMAVFMVPMGSEADYRFNTKGGLTDIGNQIPCKRLLAVCCNRPHFDTAVLGEDSLVKMQYDSQAVQNELSPVALSLKPFIASTGAGMGEESPIPFMAIGQDSDYDLISKGSSALSGTFIIEECDDTLDRDRGTGKSAVLRRLIFLQNQTVVQTEVRLVRKMPKGQTNNTKGGKKGGKNKKNSNNKDSGMSDTHEILYEFDYGYLDAHHIAVLAGLCLSEHVTKTGSSISTPLSTSTKGIPSAARGLIVGMGGGALTMALQRYLPSIHLWACDLDEAVVTTASEYFGFKSNSRTHVMACEGLGLLNHLHERFCHDSSGTSDANGCEVVPLYQGIDFVIDSKNEGLLDLLCLDVDSKDLSIGMSAPPMAFATTSSLQMMHALLNPGGVLCINVVARSDGLFQQLVRELSAAFNAPLSSCTSSGDRNMKENGRLFQIRPSDETLNVVVIAIKAEASAGTSTVLQDKDSNANTKTKAGFGNTTGTGNKKQGLIQNAEKQYASRLERWLEVVGLEKDPLKIEEMLTRLRES